MTIFFRAVDIPVKEEGDNGEENKRTVPAAHMAGLLPFECWAQSSLVSPIWTVKWPPVTSKGLQPVRPMIVAKENMVIPAGKAIEVVKAPA